MRLNHVEVNTVSSGLFFDFDFACVAPAGSAAPAPSAAPALAPAPDFVGLFWDFGFDGICFVHVTIIDLRL